MTLLRGCRKSRLTLVFRFAWANGLVIAIRYGWTAWVVLAMLLLVTALAVKNAMLGSPIMAGDEYAYFSRAREFPLPDVVLTYDPTVQATNNVLYFAIGHWFWANTSDPALGMRILQAGEYGLLLLVLYSTCRLLMGPLSSGVVAIVAGVTAMSSYTAYFMPETLYQLLFACLCFIAVALLPRRTVTGGAACGGMLALMLLTKPHGIAAVLAVGSLLLAIVAWPSVFCIPRRRSAPALLVLLPATWATLVLVNLVLVGRLQLNPGFVVGSFYESVLVGSASPLPPLRNLLPPIIGNWLAVALLAGIPLVFIACGFWFCIQPRGTTPGDSPTDVQTARFTVLAALALAMLAFALGMTISFTARVGEYLPTELWRLHGRYYSFALPVCIIAMAAGATLWPEQGGRVSSHAAVVLRLAALLMVGVTVVAQLWWRTAYTLAPWDFPEIWALTPAGWLADANKVGTLLLLFGAGCSLLILVLPRLVVPVFLVFFAVFNLASLVQSTRWQFAHGNGFAPYSQPAAALRLLFGPDLIDRGVVVGPDRGMITYTLFPLRSRSRVVLLPVGSVVDLAAIGANPAWVLMQGSYEDHLPGRVIFKSAKLTLVALDDSVAIAPLSRPDPARP